MKKINKKKYIISEIRLIDKKGRFTKEDFPNERYEFKFCLPPLKNFIFIILSYHNLSSLESNYFNVQTFEKNISILAMISFKIKYKYKY